MSETKITKLNSVAAGETVETAMEQAQRLQKEVDEYKAYVDTLDDPKALEDEEKKCIAELEEFDKYIKGVTYDIPADVVFEGKRYSRSDVAGKILYFISKNEVTWQYTLGLYQLCQFWKNTAETKLTYGQLDSTLRLLDQQKFRGYEEWRDILLVNEYMKALHEAYTKDLALQIAASQKHNAVLERIDLTSKVTTEGDHKDE